MSAGSTELPLAYATPNPVRSARFWRGFAITGAVYTAGMAVLVAFFTAATSASFSYLFEDSAWTVDRVALVLIHTMLVPILLTVGNAIAVAGGFSEAKRLGAGRWMLKGYVWLQLLLLAAWLFATTVVTAQLVKLPLATPTTGLRYHACRWLSAFPTSLVGASALWLLFSMPMIGLVIAWATGRWPAKGVAPSGR